MRNITSQDMLDLLYGKKLPQVYRDKDSEIGYPLKRYLESLIEGGYYGSIKDIEGMMSLIDPVTIPDEYFPYLCESFGLTYFPDIDISYQRKFLSNLGEIIRRRGTFSCVRFLIRVLTGLEANLSYIEGELNGEVGNFLNIILLAKDLEQIDKIDTSMKVIGSYISSHIPYYIKPVLSSQIDVQIIGSKSYAHSIVSCSKYYSINKYKEGN